MENKNKKSLQQIVAEETEKSSDPDFSEEESKLTQRIVGKQEKSYKKSSSPQKKEQEFMNRSMPVSPPVSNFKVRTIWTLCMLFGFMVIIAGGQFYCMILVLVIIQGMYSEILDIRRNKLREQEIPLFNTLNWYFFFVSLYFGFAKFLISKMLREFNVPILYHLYNKHHLISFMLWIIGFLLFVISLKKGFYKYQFRQFAWTHIGCLLLVGQTSVIVYNIYEGIFWFVIPCLMVICNDIFAYLFGFFFGKTKLIELSPKKTWEGFIGGFLSSLFFSVVLSWIFLQFDFFLCPQNDLGIIPFANNSCVIQDHFLFKPRELPSLITLLTGFKSINMADVQFHAINLSVFASIAAPFGGFFASGFKRALKIKDFGDKIPGHGGITDRFDCQVLMGMFSYVYINQVVLSNIPNINEILHSVNMLRLDDQLIVFKELEKILLAKNILNATSILN